MVYNSVSIKEVIARITMNTNGSIPSEFYDYFLEWIPQAMGMLRTKYPLHKVSEQVEIIDHTAKLPCGLVYLDAVTDCNGRRLREGGDMRDMKTVPNAVITDNFYYRNTEPSVDITIDDPELKELRIVQATVDNKRGANIQEVNQPDIVSFYKIQLGYIQTSFQEGSIILHFYKQPTDEEGYPLIPDNEWYKEALYYFVLSKMIAASYQHPIFNFKDVEERWLINRRKAITSITWPSIDTMERVRQTHTAMIPPQSLYDNFFLNSEQIKNVRNG